MRISDKVRPNRSPRPHMYLCQKTSERSKSGDGADPAWRACSETSARRVLPFVDLLRSACSSF
jgi:hypothetical protein